MMFFIPPKRKLIELGLLLILLLGFYFISPQLEVLILIAFGFIWNWSASNDLANFFELNKRYRLSLLKFVFNIQNLFLAPFKSAPLMLRKIISILPAGIFWSAVIYINESNVPYWPPFVGSLAFELINMDLSKFQKKNQHV